MITVTKTVRFDAAHVLTNHQGLCKNLHGHTYRVDISVTQAAGDVRDMVIDFKDLKKIATEIICDRFDHAFVYNTASEGEREINFFRVTVLLLSSFLGLKRLLVI